MSGLPLPRFAGRRRVRDNMMTFDSARFGGMGDHPGVPLGGRFKSFDGTKTFDSTGAFLVGELERLDLTLHMPLAAVSYQRDIQMREDVTLADEASSFTLSSFASAGGAGSGQGVGTGKAWIGKVTDQITGIDVDIAKVPLPMRLWGVEIKYTIPELESAAKLGRPVDAQKYEGMKLKHQMDIDEQVYFGDTTTGDTGLINSDANSAKVKVTNVAAVANGAQGTPQWTTKTPDEILQDFNEALTSAWAAAAWAVIPGKVLLPPAQFGYISTQKVSNAGNMSILRYVLENNLLTSAGAPQLDIKPAKWLIGAGSGGTITVTGTVDRMVVYTNEKERVRYPMTLLQRTPIQYDSIYHKTTYFCRLGVMELVYPETIAYRDGL